MVFLNIWITYTLSILTDLFTTYTLDVTCVIWYPKYLFTGLIYWQVSDFLSETNTYVYLSIGVEKTV